MKKKILIYSSSYLPTTGGLQFFIYWFLKSLDKNIFNFEIYFLTHNKSKYTKFKNIKTIIVKKKNFLENLFLFYKIQKKKKFSSILTFNIITDTLVFVFLKFFFRFRLLCNCQGDDLAYNKKFFYGARLDFFKNLLFHFVKIFIDLIIVASSSMFNIAIESGIKKKKLCIIRNGFEFTNFKTANKTKLRRKYKIAINKTVFLCISGHRKIKNIDGIIKGLSKIKKNFELILCSNGEETNNLKTLSKKLGIDNRIKFFNFVKGKKKIEIFQLSDIYINLAYFEPFGLTYLEAIESNLAVIGSKFGGAVDIFRHNHEALIVDPKNNKQIDNALNKIFLHKIRKSLVINAKKKLDYYNINLVTKLYVKKF